MYRFPDPLDEDSLKALVADPRYGDPFHPEHPYYRQFVDKAFSLVYPDPPRNGAGDFVIDPRDPPQPQVITGGDEFRPWETDDDTGGDAELPSPASDWPETPTPTRTRVSTGTGPTVLGLAGEVRGNGRQHEQPDPEAEAFNTSEPGGEQLAQHMPVEPEYRDSWRSTSGNIPVSTSDNFDWPDYGHALGRRPPEDETDPETARNRRYRENYRRDVYAREQAEIDALNPVYVSVLGKRESEGKGYGAFNSEGNGMGAIGRYQFRQPALQDIGLVDQHGRWLCKEVSGQRICSASDFWNNPRAQDIALA